MLTMRTIETEFFPTEEHPEYGLGLSVYLGPADWPPLQDLHEGESILLVEPNELEAEATARLALVNERPTWFGVLASRDAIRVIYQPAPSANADPSASIATPSA